MKLKRLAVVAALVFPVALSAQAPVQPAPQAPPRDAVRTANGTATIHGRIVAADTGRPIRGARIQAAGGSPGPAKYAFSGDDGRYELSQLAGGRLSISVTADGFVGLGYGQTRPFEAAKPLIVADGALVSDVNFALPRGGVIAGTVLDDLHDPLPGAVVVVSRSVYRDGRRSLTQVATALANDLGEFRAYGLSPGSYYVSARKRAAGAIASVIEAESTYAPTYFPGTVNVAEAERVVVELGKTKSGIDMTLSPSRVAAITGTALDLDGQPITASAIDIRQLDVTTPVALSVVVGSPRPDGAFTITGVPPGNFELRTWALRQPDGIPQVAIAQVSVNGENATGLRLLAAKMSTATGRFVVDPADAPALSAASVSVSTAPVEAGHMVYYAGASTVAPDLSFVVRTPPGRLLVRPTVPKGWVVKAVRSHGVDVTDVGIDVPVGGDVDGIDVELTHHPPQLSGSAKGSKGESLSDYSVVIFARDPERRASPRYFALARPDQNGTFTLSTLPPGDYFAAALEYVEADTAADPDFLRTLVANAVPFVLNEGEEKTLDLKVTP